MIKVELIKSKRSDYAYVAQCSGAVHGIEVAGRSRQVIIGLDEISHKLARDVTDGAINRAAGGKLPYGVQEKVREAVLAAFKQLTSEVGS